MSCIYYKYVVVSIEIVVIHKYVSRKYVVCMHLTNQTVKNGKNSLFGNINFKSKIYVISENYLVEIES